MTIRRNVRFTFRVSTPMAADLLDLVEGFPMYRPGTPGYVVENGERRPLPEGSAVTDPDA